MFSFDFDKHLSDVECGHSYDSKSGHLYDSESGYLYDYECRSYIADLVRKMIQSSLRIQYARSRHIRLARIMNQSMSNCAYGLEIEIFRAERKLIFQAKGLENENPSSHVESNVFPVRRPITNHRFWCAHIQTFLALHYKTRSYHT